MTDVQPFELGYLLLVGQAAATESNALLIALVGIAGSLIVAVVGVGGTLWATKIAGDRERERLQREDDRHFRDAGEAAARAVLQEVEAVADLISDWRRDQPHDDSGPNQDQLRPFHDAIRAKSVEINDADVRATMDHVAHVLYLQELARQQFVDWQLGNLAFRCRSAARAVLGAYLRGESIPEEPELVAVSKDIADYFEETDCAEKESQAANRSGGEISDQP